MKRSAPLTTALLTFSLLSSASAAPVKVSFWHSMEGVKDVVAGYARDFNASQTLYDVVPVAVGPGQVANLFLQARGDPAQCLNGSAGVDEAVGCHPLGLLEQADGAVDVAMVAVWPRDGLGRSVTGRGQHAGGPRSPHRPRLPA